MPNLYERTVIDLNQGSCVVCLPKAWLRYHNIKPGDKVEVVTDVIPGTIQIRPKPKNIKQSMLGG